jgi:nitrilase
MANQLKKQFRLAAVQAAPVFLDRDATIDKSVTLIEQAASNDATLVGFPETWIPGYPWWIWLGSPAWGMQFVAPYHTNSLVIGSPEAQRIIDAARDNNIHVVMGYSEKADGSLYMGQMIVNRKGEVVATRRKLKPTHVERSVFGEGDGGDLAVHEFDIGNVGALCCWEHLQPLSKYAMYSQNEQIHVASWPSFSLYTDIAYALGPQANTTASQMYALEGQCYVIASCAVVAPEMVELLCDTPDKRELLRPGGGFSMIFGPDGSPLCEPLPEDQDGILYADGDVAMILIAKSAADPSGHYSRPDVTRLLFNRTATRPVEDMRVPVDQVEGRHDAEPAPPLDLEVLVGAEEQERHVPLR